MTNVLRWVVVGVIILGWVSMSVVLAVGYLPKRPDSAAYFIAQALFVPGLIMKGSIIYPKREEIVALGSHLQSAAFGGLLICFLLFYFGGYRAASVVH